jgi:hypothetical protein
VRVAAVALVGVMLSGLAGCGGGTLSRAGFEHDSERICRDANARFARIRVASPTASGAEAALASVVAIGTAALGDLRTLKPPKGSGSRVDAWLGALEQALDEVRYARSLLHDEEIVRGLAALARADVLARRARVLGHDLGVARTCDVPRLVPGD